MSKITCLHLKMQSIQSRHEQIEFDYTSDYMWLQKTLVIDARYRRSERKEKYQGIYLPLQGREFIFPTLSLDIYAQLILMHSSLSNSVIVTHFSSSYLMWGCNKSFCVWLCVFTPHTSTSGYSSKPDSSGWSSGHLPSPRCYLAASKWQDETDIQNVHPD